MIYLETTFDLEPATYATRDAFIDHAENTRVAALEAEGAQLRAAWFSNEVRFSRISELWAFADLGAFDVFRGTARDIDPSPLDQLAPHRRHRLFEPLGPIPPEALAAAIDASTDRPEGRYTLATLDMVPGRMNEFVELLDSAKDRLAIIASLREVAGHPNRVLDIWSGDIGQGEFQTNSASAEAFLGTLRQVAPDERISVVTPLPYSPLR